MNRRQWLATAAGIAAFPAALRSSRAQTAIEPISDRFFVIRGLGGNVLVCRTSAGLVLVDSGNDSGSQLRELLENQFGTASVHTLINTHWHPEQTAGNAMLGAGGTQIVAHAKAHQRLSAGYYLRAEERYTAPSPDAGIPQRTFYTTEELSVGDVTIECGYLLEAHTDGDIYAWFAQQNLIAAGDVISPEIDPVIDWFGGGWIGGRLDALAKLLEISDSQTRFLPSFGPVVDRDYVARELSMMTTIFERMVELIRQGMSAEDCIEAGVMEDLGRQFADPLTFIDATHRSLWAHHNTLSHDIV
jgi:cyclase